MIYTRFGHVTDVFQCALRTHTAKCTTLSLCVFESVSLHVDVMQSPSTLHSKPSPFSSGVGFWFIFWRSSWALSLLLYTHLMLSCCIGTQKAQNTADTRVGFYPQPTTGSPSMIHVKGSSLTTSLCPILYSIHCTVQNAKNNLSTWRITIHFELVELLLLQFYIL